MYYNLDAFHLTIFFCQIRFAPEFKRNPLAFLGFGAGPRYCIGMKFALLVLKITLVNLIGNFEVLPSKDTPKVLELTEGVVRAPKGGVDVSIVKRPNPVF